MLSALYTNMIFTVFYVTCDFWHKQIWSFYSISYEICPLCWWFWLWSLIFEIHFHLYWIFFSLFSLLYSFSVKISIVRLVCMYEDAHAHIYSGCNELRFNENIFKVKIKVSKYVYTNRWFKSWFCVYDVIKHSVITAILARSSLKMFLIG